MEEVVSYADMLRSGEDEGAYLFSPAPSSISSPSSACYSTAAAQMLCFGAMEEDAPIVPLHGVVVPLQRSSDSSSMSSLSSSPSSIPAANTVAISKTAKKKVGSGSSRIGGKKAANGAATSSAMKKPKTEATNTCHGSTKVRKEKIGDRIIALQQLVSPFGKSDTASVLHEALGYIRFLHDQVQVLSSPYLQRLPSSANLQEGRIRSGDLRGRGLCLVPVSCMEHVASTNGADLWSPAAMGSNEQQISSPADLKH